MLRGKKIILGVTGSIAAYKAVVLLRMLTASKADVRVVMTPSAKKFVSPLTFSTLSENKAYISFVQDNMEQWNNHTELGVWADAMVIAPTSANTLAKMTHGICDNFLLATYLSSTCPVFVAPAMDIHMWKHNTTQKNISLLNMHANLLIAPRHGELASGMVGMGRMAEPEEIVTSLTDFFKKKNSQVSVPL